MPPMPVTAAGGVAVGGTSTGKRKRSQMVSVEALPVNHADPRLPTVCYLPSNGCAGLSGSVSSAKRLRFSVYSRPGKVAHAVAQQMVHAAPEADTAVDYFGTSNSAEYSSALPCSFALGVFDKASGRLQVLPVAGGRAFRVEPRMSGLTYVPPAAASEEAADQSLDERRMAAKRLVEEFGSTRRRRQMTAREEGVVRADRISGGEHVEALLADAMAKRAAENLTREEVLRKAFEGRTVPPHNPNATEPRAAYPLELLLGGRQLLRHLDAKRLLDAAASTDKEEHARASAAKSRDGAASLYVLDRLILLRNEPDDNKKQETARYLALLAVLLRLQANRTLRPKDAEGGSAGGLSDLARQYHVREELMEHLLDKFYVQGDDATRGLRYERTDAQSKLLLAYVLAVAVAAEDGLLGERQFDALRVVLKLEASKLADIMAQLGCTTRRSTDVKAEGGGATYTANLLRLPGKADKTLAQSFPAFKLAKAKGR